MNDLLIEMGCEDLPARYVMKLAECLRDALQQGLSLQGLIAPASSSADPPACFATPRRIAVRFAGVKARSPDGVTERKGPKLAAALKDGAPTAAGLGFAKSCGVEFSKLLQEDGQLVFRQQQPGRRTVELVPELFDAALKSMDALVPKRMRWGRGEETFVRPVEWLLALYGGSVIPLSRFGLKAGRATYGHRFHAPKAVRLRRPRDFEGLLLEARVWADFATRREEIRRQIVSEARTLGGTPKIDPSLLEEVTALVEWPVVISGRFEERFLELPPEVIVATVETNQRYFTLFDASRRLLPCFITVANIASRDVAQVIAGNERVVRPRLADALFFWRHDTKTGLDGLAGRLGTTTYQKDLGSLAGKVQRIGTIARCMLADTALPAPAAGRADPAAVDRAVGYCKLDLFTRTVFEFPELQGQIGGYLAALGGETPAVTTAIRDHYAPTQSGTPIPMTAEGQVLALADKLDALAGIFAIGQKPTASKDPYALRRAALGVLRICIEGAWDIDLRPLLAAALAEQPAGRKDAAILDELWNFLLERLRGYALDAGATAEEFEAVRANGITRPLDFFRRLQALRAFAGSEAAASLAAADKRARNLLKQAGGSSGESATAVRYDHASERDLADVLSVVEGQAATLRECADYVGMLRELARLKGPVDAFFDNVMVMADDPAVRAHRLALLARLDGLCRDVADLSLLPG